MNEAATLAVMNQMFFDPFSIPHHNQFVILNVSRENIVADTLRELSQYNSSDLKKPLRVSISTSFYSKYFICNTQLIKLLYKGKISW